jgi:uncharacterized protein (DUF433 family)
MSKLTEIAQAVRTLSTAEKAQLLQWISHDLGQAFPGIESTPGVCGGEPCIVRTRIPVWLVQHMRNQRATDPDILYNFPLAVVEELRRLGHDGSRAKIQCPTVRVNTTESSITRRGAREPREHVHTRHRHAVHQCRASTDCADSSDIESGPCPDSQPPNDRRHKDRKSRAALGHRGPRRVFPRLPLSGAVLYPTQCRVVPADTTRRAAATWWGELSPHALPIGVRLPGNNDVRHFHARQPRRGADDAVPGSGPDAQIVPSAIASTSTLRRN